MHWLAHFLRYRPPEILLGSVDYNSEIDMWYVKCSARPTWVCVCMHACVCACVLLHMHVFKCACACIHVWLSCLPLHRGVGCIFYEMGIGKPMFPGASVEEELELIWKVFSMTLSLMWCVVTAQL